MLVNSFLRDEAGAVTVDWVTLTAAAIGLGLAGVSAVSVGVRSLGTDVETSLTGASVAPLYDTTGVLYTMGEWGFDNGQTHGWSHSRLSSTEALGTFMGPFSGTEGPVEFAVRFPGDATRAVIEFDLLTLDSWDGWAPNGVNDVRNGGRGDGVAFTIDGQEIHYSAFTAGSTQFPTGQFQLNGTTFNMSIQNQRTGQFTDPSLSDNAAWQDGVWRVQVVAENPPPQGFNFGLQSTVNQRVRDESMGIDNFRVNAFTD